MYERPDVPKDSPHRNLIAVIVLVVVIVAIGVLVTTLWDLANANSVLGSNDLGSAVESTIPAEESIWDQAEATGLTATGDEIETVLFAVASDDSEGSLATAYLAVLNNTQGTAKLLQFAPDEWIQAGEENLPVADWYAQKGAAGLASAISGSAVVPVSHIVVMTQGGWDSFMSIASKGSSALQSQSRKLIKGITQTDMDAMELVDIAQRAVTNGASSDSIAGVAANEVTDEEGTTRLQVDSAQLALAVGTLA